MRTITLTMAALVLTGCRQTAPDQNASVPSAPSNVSNVTAEIVGLPDGQRNAVFMRAIRDAGFACQGVPRSEQVGGTVVKPTWRAECSDGTAHLVQVARDGTAVITSRTAP